MMTGQGCPCAKLSNETLREATSTQSPCPHDDFVPELRIQIAPARQSKPVCYAAHVRGLLR